jgi:hypothetical protein
MEPGCLFEPACRKYPLRKRLLWTEWLKLSCIWEIKANFLTTSGC